jgi:hypothetical protein
LFLGGREKQRVLEQRILSLAPGGLVAAAMLFFPDPPELWAAGVTPVINCRLAMIPTFMLCIAASIGLHVAGEVGPPLPPEAAPGQPPIVVPLAPTSAPATDPANQPLPRPQPPNNTIKTSGSLAPPQVAKIDSFVRDSVERLVKGADVQTVADARSDLISGAASPNQQSPASSPYLTQYVTSLAYYLGPKLAQGTLNQRVNCGIVLARVGENAIAAQVGVLLQPLYRSIITEMRDPSQAIALWGMKAAAVAITSAPGASSQEVLNEVIPCVQKHGYNGPITADAYNALSDPKPQVIAAVMQIYKERTGLYGNGLPDEPSVDRKAASHLTTNSGMWGKMTPPQQNQVMNLIRENLDAATKAIEVADTPPDMVNDLRILIRETCKAVEVVAIARNLTSLRFDSQKGADISDTDPPSDVAIRVQRVIGGLQVNFPPNTAGGGAAVNPTTIAKP